MTDLLAGYHPRPGRWDEMVDRDGRVREHWSGVAPVLAGLGVDELGRRRDEAVHLPPQRALVGGQ